MGKSAQQMETDDVDVANDGGQQRRAVSDSGPPSVNVFQLMEVVLEKVKLLDYEANFCRARNMKPLNKTYFAMPSSNPSEQLFSFTSMAHWLLSMLGRNFSAPEP